MPGRATATPRGPVAVKPTGMPGRQAARAAVGVSAEPPVPSLLKSPDAVPITHVWQCVPQKSGKTMKSTIQHFRAQGGALALALVFLLGGCGFALFRAFVGGMASGAVGSPALLMF